MFVDPVSVDSKSGKAKANGSGVEEVGRSFWICCEWLCVHEGQGGGDERYKWLVMRVIACKVILYDLPFCY